MTYWAFQSSMEGESPVHTQLLRIKARQVIYSSSEDEGGQYRIEAPEAQVDQDISIHCVSSPLQIVSDSGSSQPAPQGDLKSPTEPGTIINLTYITDSPWELGQDTQSDEDSKASVTSTPAFKRRRHAQKEKTPDPKKDNPNFYLKWQLVRLIQKEGMLHPVPKWARSHSPSVLILSDSQLKHWPEADNVCKLIYHPDWPVKRWVQAIKLGDIWIEYNTVVIYLEGLRSWSDVPPIKNALHTLCKMIRMYGNNGLRMFIANHLPQAVGSPVHPPIANSNFTLCQAISSVSRAMIKVH